MVCIVFLKFTASSDLMVTYVIRKICVTVIIFYALLTLHTYSLSQPSVCTCASYMPQWEGGREGGKGGREGGKGCSFLYC